MPIYKPFICEGPFDPVLQRRVKEFILKVSRNELGTIPDSPCVLLKDDRPIRVLYGGYWELKERELYAAHDPERDIPIWVPPVLSCIRLFWGLKDDQETQDAILETTCKMAADLFRPMRQAVMQSFGGLELTTLAINSETRELAGEYPPDPLDSQAQPVWRAPISGLEIPGVRVEGSSWHVFSLTT